MRKSVAVLFATFMMVFVSASAGSPPGRDILLVARSVGSWEYTDDAVALLSDGTRLRFDLRDLPREVLGDTASPRP